MRMAERRALDVVVSTIEYDGWHWDKIAEALAPAKVVRLKPGDKAGLAAALPEADACLLAGDLDDTVLEAGQKLRWIHCNHAGVNNSARPEVFRRGIILTSAAGRSGPVLAEHTFYLLLSLVYRARLAHRMQNAHEWANIYADSRGLYGKTMGIVGLGFTGREIAARAKAFGMRVLAFTRGGVGSAIASDAALGGGVALPPHVDRLWTAAAGDGLDALLQESDVVVLSARLSDATYHMIDARAFSLMKPSALVVNIARGAVWDEAALVEALRSGGIAGAASDVFEREPLPQDSPLWDIPNFVMTPHCTPEMPDMPGNCVAIICDNIRAFRAGAPLRNAVDARDQYTIYHRV